MFANFELVQLVVYLVSLLGFPESEDTFSWASSCAVELQKPAWIQAFYLTVCSRSKIIPITTSL
jgi:hypothetical protein